MRMLQTTVAGWSFDKTPTRKSLPPVGPTLELQCSDCQQPESAFRLHSIQQSTSHARIGMVRFVCDSYK